MARRIAARVKPRIYYGWIIVAVAFLVHLATGSLNPVFGLFIIPIQNELGWTRPEIVFAATIATLATAMMRPFAGPVIDRTGGRALLVGAAVVGGTSVALVSLVNAPWQFYLAYGVLGAALIHGVGQQVTGVVVSKWFVAKRGRALGFAFTGISLGPFIGVGLVTVAIAGLGWRTTYVLLGLTLAAVIAVPAALFLRRSPEDMELLPDGAESLPTPSDEPPTDDARSREPDALNLREALHTRALWLTVGAWAFASLPVAGYFINVIPYLHGEQGFSAMASVAWTVFFANSAASKVVWGFLTERIPVRLACAICFLGEAAGIILLLLVGQSRALLFAWAFVAGFFHGPFAQLQTLIWADYFGRRSLGTIQGFTAPFTILSSSVGPLAAAYAFQQLGSYRMVWGAFAGLLALAALMVSLTKPPQRRAKTASV